MNPAGFLLVVLIRLYRKLVSPVLTALFGPMGLGCRFSPTCSVYALEALHIHGTSRGFGLAIRRFCRCHPWGPSGYDPVPPREDKVGPMEHRFPD